MSTENCYQAVLESIPKTLRAVATRVLSWILHAARPMRVDELSIALAIDTCEDMPFDRSNIRRDIVETIVPILCPILTIRREHLIFCHPSAKQYIQDETRRKNDQWAVEHFTHDTATRCCLAYLNYAVLQSGHSLPEVVHDLPGGKGEGLATGETSFHDYATAGLISFPFAKELDRTLPRYRGISTTIPTLRTPQITIDDKAIQPHFLQLCELGLVEILNEYADFICNEGNDLQAGLHIAADQGNVAVIKWILESGISSKGAFDELLRAAEKSFLGEVFQVLLEYVLRSCSHMINDSIYGQLLNVICEQGQGEAARLLLAVKPLRKSFIRSQNKLPYMECSKPLRLAAAIGHQGIIEMLFGMPGFRQLINSSPRLGEVTPLHLAAQNGHLDIVKLLIDEYRDRENNVGENALHTAVNLAVNLLGSDVRSGRNYVEIIELLLSDEGSLELVSSLQDDGWSSLHIAHTNATVTELLLNTGASIYAGQTTPCGSTALTLAAKAGCATVVSLLLKRDSEHRNYPSGLRQDGGGYTPLHWAARNGHTEVVAILLRHSNDPMLKVNGVQDTDVPCEGTALHLAYVNGHLAAFKLILESLLEGGVFQVGDIVDINHQTGEGHTVLFYAAAWGYTDICRMLLEKGINRNLQDNEGRVAADVANSETIRDLILHWVSRTGPVTI
ncbi:ankyrin repeat-containing domain protein [Terfezia claveryi]|nr:ankyrin repeat-containing domain protein [Terfezia claveryi]